MQVYFVSSLGNDPLALVLNRCLSSYSKSSLVIEYSHQSTSFSSRVKKIIDADVVVCQVSLPSTEVGVCLALACQLQKPLLVCSRVCDVIPSFSTLIDSGRESVIMVKYTDQTAYKEFSGCFDFLASSIESRFNFCLSQRLRGYLLWAAKYYQLPQSVYLRRLIEQDLNNNPDFDQQLRNGV